MFIYSLVYVMEHSTLCPNFLCTVQAASVAPTSWLHTKANIGMHILF